MIKKKLLNTIKNDLANIFKLLSINLTDEKDFTEVTKIYKKIVKKK